MYHKHHLFLSFVISVIFPLSSQSNNKFLDCATTWIACDDNRWEISYPFRLPGMPAYCGHPDFELQRIRNNSVLQIIIAEKAYRISSIRYDIQFVGVSHLDHWADSCPHTFSNTTVDFSLFKYADNGMNMTMFFNCSPLDPAQNHVRNVSCLSSSTSSQSYYSLPSDDPPAPMKELYEKCSSMVLIPMYRDIREFFVQGRLDFLGVLQDGFGLNWIAGNDWCNKCQDSGGVCGNHPNPKGAPACFCGDGRVANRTCPDKGSNTSRNTIIGVGAGGVGFLILGCVLVIFLYNRRKKQRQSSSSNLLSRNTSTKMSSKRDPELGDGNYRTHIFSYHELEEATNGFNASRELGDGGFGTVYKGKLKDGRTVAVKRLYENNYRRLEQFMNEVDILSLLRHPNLVTLYGFYEFVSNGTLADHLHGALASKGALLWPTRMSIAIETADALAYLHAIEPQIIHRDVKTNNILLDSNFHVKVADFGLSRLFPLDATHVSTAPQGTPGYVDPEYHQCYQLTDKSDVYSFGVVLVELISSKPAVDISRHRHEINLSNMAINKIQNCQIDQLVDPDLGYQTHTEIKGMINQVAELAFRCLQPDRDMRPCIKEVLEVLNGIEGGGHNGDKEVEVTQVQAKEESRLLKNVSPFSPDTVTERWSSESTTPNTSG
ncbi:LEAF RUST 10 DISEASE-RESISTANCE LOCUS RECEPTOR-LIKE PROTEIN KINASE-like 1.2 isoform X1 [Asparagus officinalis]|uniref:LEAF RUST 10 DISEASE-RESISTANCE LOCUS RECEPTOR-LIKE PROTEIN KINASE-like 1.2 isoform X1 n=1 Tax=Asparagus officinalis TaxID=4686 RepID=UPI00098E7CB0|nr:LEAF RUST 10 DISEASE-RESISTANCE LOCUS RECEPTOR-LIKE PROTEIN KINASE-like 1.2 isoform X1 [Asparagus officinalis]